MLEVLGTIGALGGMTAVVYGLGRLGATVRSSDNVRCPVKGTRASVDFNCRTDAAWGAGQRKDVLRCSLLPNPECVDCAKDCLRQ